MATETKSRIEAFREILARKAARRKKTLDERYRDALQYGLIESETERHERIMADDAAWTRL